MRLNLIPSPVQKHMVPGVCGERIVSGLSVLSKINFPVKVNEDARIIKPIPERNGNFTGKILKRLIYLIT